MERNDIFLPIAAIIRQLVATMKELSLKFEDTKMITAFLNGLSNLFDSLISAFDAAYKFDDKLSF